MADPFLTKLGDTPSSVSALLPLPSHLPADVTHGERVLEARVTPMDDMVVLCVKDVREQAAC